VAPEPAPPSERLGARLGRQARQRAPLTRAKKIAWAAVGIVVLALLVAQLLFGARPPWVDRLEKEKREEKARATESP
jgi:hypothetical protein